MTTDVPQQEIASEAVRPAQRVSLREQVADELQRLIVGGAIAAGAALPSEAQLGETFHCSRSVVREALRDVEQRGLVVRAENGRALIVQPASLDTVSRAVHIYMELGQVTFAELFESLELLDPVASALAAERGDGATLDALRALNEPARLTLANLVEVEVAFHLRLAQASGNRLFVAAWKPILDALAIANAEVAPLMGTPALTGTRRAHDEVIRAVAAHDAAAAAAWSRRHCAAFRRGLDLLGRSARDPVRPLQ
ncbi:MAG TPA: FCD domain-containing protein [Dehalococcoidia bacterium]|nr:FCD domain-containing protein [Dehalococcoidia bacterium]